MNLDDAEVVEFMTALHAGDWQKGLSLWAAKYKKDALEVLMNSEDQREIQAAQAELRMFNAKLPRLLDAYQDFARQQSAQRPGA
jgi:hypothetical protein